MRPLRPLLLILAAGFSLGACATPPPAGDPVADSKPPAEEPAMNCQAEKGQWAKGEVADATVVARLKTETTSERVRIIRPGMSVTMDYREDRLNLEVDSANRILVIRCG